MDLAPEEPTPPAAPRPPEPDVSTPPPEPTGQAPTTDAPATGTPDLEVSTSEAPKPAESRHPLAGVMAFFARKGLAPEAVATAGLAFCTLGALCYVVDHPGLAGVLGLVGLLLGEVAAAPEGDTGPLVSSVNVLSDLAIPAGYVGAAAVDASGINVLLGLLALIFFGWLPYLAARSPADMGVAARTFWRRPERMAVLLLGGMLAHPVVPLLLVVAAGVADAWLALDRLARVGIEPRRRPAFLDALLRPDGSIQPLLRWGSLLIALLLLVVLPHGEGWRF